MFDLNTPEEELKNKVGREFFADFDTTERTNNIDFMVAPKITHPLHHPSVREGKSLRKIYFLWAEAKKGNKSDIYASIVQLILTIGKANGEIKSKKLRAPSFFGAFDAQRFAILPYSQIMSIFTQSDFNWSVTPSNHESKEFKQLYAMIKETLESESLIFDFDKHSDELREFIHENFTINNATTTKIQITKNNLKNVYLDWVEIVKPTISCAWEQEKPDIIDADFFIADLLSRNNRTEEIRENLRILLQSDRYKVKGEMLKLGRIKDIFEEFYFNDNQKAHKRFWNLYERPPKNEIQNYIISRRDLLVPQDIRERKGAFFTPRIWVKKAQDYLAKSLGDLWQDEYYIWDCAAGSGNLLIGLNDKYKIFASTIDKSDVDGMIDRIRDSKLDLLESHTFQFDFLNDDFFDKVDKSGKIIAKSKLPDSLQEILRDESKRQKLVIFINPPYAEAASSTTPSGTGTNKIGVATDNKTYEKYKSDLSKASNELFAQFFMRIYKEIPNCILGSFSTLKYINSSNFIAFRKIFKAKFLKGFAIPAWTFDNVKGDFPIGFIAWDLGDKQTIKKCKIDMFNENNKKIHTKRFYALGENDKTINDWIKDYSKHKGSEIGLMVSVPPMFQTQQRLAFLSKAQARYCLEITKYNLMPFCVYFAVRHAIKHSWINHEDRFLRPNKKWRGDSELHNDCLAFSLFCGKNRISSKDIDLGENHFIPFSESQVGAKERFKSHFMFEFINGKVKNGTFEDCFIPETPLIFSAEAKAVFDAGREIWRYYHAKTFNDSQKPYNANASLYDIKEHFQGRGENGKMNNKSTDSHYNDLIANLRIALNALAQKIEPKIYEYEFLRE